MKKQINATIKAHLLRSAFILLSLLTACVIPFALGQRHAPKSRNPAAHAQSTRISNVNGTAPAAARIGGPVASAVPPAGEVCPATITESTSQSIVDGNSVACNNGFGTTENHYWRAFDMNTFTGGQAYDITSVSFGIELAASGSGAGQPLTVNLYANHGSPFPGGDWQSNLLASSGSINIPDQADTIFSVPLAATVPAGTLELVMEVTTPDGEAVGNLFFIGSNPDPETGPSYLSAAACGLPDPTPTADIGFPDMHIVMNVNGSCEGGTPTPTPTSTPPTPTPTPTPTPPQCTYSVLVVSADCGDPATTLLASLRAEPGIGTVDLFDATISTPTLAQLQQYAIVLPFSNCGYQDGTTLGNNLDAYLSGGGIVVALNFDWYGGTQSIGGAWITNDSPFNDNATVNFTTGTLQTCTDAGLCDGVTTLQSFFREITTLASGATAAGTWSDGSIMMASKGRTVGISGYFGDYADNYSGQLPRIVANAGRLFSPCPTPTPTPTPTVTPTPTPGQIVLTAQSRRTHAGLMVRLNWSGATTAQVDIYRNGAPLARVPNNGSYIDTLTTFGTYTYKVCNKNTMNCSNEVTKRFGGGGQ